MDRRAPAEGEQGLSVVGLVASAGGLEAISRVVAALPATFPGAIVALQHMAPGHPSQLAEILAHRTMLQVKPAEDRDRLRPGMVFVAPAGRHTLVCPDQTIALICSGQAPPWRPSADLLLTSMAVSFRERTVAVVLSGHDGTAGAAAVKRLGGLVIAQNQVTSRQFGMPGGVIAFDKLVDRVVALGGIGRFLEEALSGRWGRALAPWTGDGGPVKDSERSASDGLREPDGAIPGVRLESHRHRGGR